MKRKLMLLNLALLVLLLAGAVELRRQIRAAEKRYEIIHRTPPSSQSPAYPEPQPPERVRQADYMPIVDRLLFSKDRNPIVEVEAPADPEPQPRPPWPLLVGVMELGDGPIALMSPGAEGSAQPVALGEKIGEFVFRGNRGETITLEWRGETFEVPHAEMTGGEETTPRVTATTNRRPQAARRTSSRNITAASDALGGRYNIGGEIRPGVHSADPSDDSPAGTEYQGYIKRVRRTPFGNQSWWEKKNNAKDTR